MTLRRHCVKCGKDFTCEFECGLDEKFYNPKACYCGECYKKVFKLQSNYIMKEFYEEICESRFGRKIAVSKIKERVVFT